MKDSLRESLDSLPHWVPWVVFPLATILLFRAFIFSNLMLFGGDTLALGYTARHFFAESIRTTGFPLWNPYLLGGTPFIESLVGGDALHPVSVALFYLTEPYRALGWKLVVHVLLSGFFMYGWLRILGVTRGSSLVGGLGFLLSPWMVSLVFPGHDGKIFVTAMTPLLFWLAEWMWRRHDLVPAALLGLSIATVILSTHFQMAYFLFGGLGAYMVFRAFQEGRWRVFGTFLLFSVLGTGAAAIQLVPAVDYVTDHSRRAATTLDATPEESRAFSSSWSLHPEEVMALVVPEFVGANPRAQGWADDTYWGRNTFKLNHEYIGVSVLLLALLAFLGPVRGPLGGIRWFLLGMGGIALLFALGAHTPVWRIFYEVVPGISLFRAPYMASFLTGFAALTLMAVGIDRAAESRERVVPTLAWAAGILALLGILAASGVLLSLWTSVLYPEIDEAARASLERASAGIVTGFFVAAAIAGALALVWRRPVGALALLLAGIVGADLFRVSIPFIQVMDPARVTVPDANIRFLQGRVQRDDPFRVLSMVQGGQDVEPATFGIELAAGHHPNDLGRYNDLIGMGGGGTPQNLAALNENLLWLLNVRYIMVPGEMAGLEPESQVRLQDGRIRASVYAYPGGPRARVVGRYRVAGADETMGIVLGSDFNPAVETVLEAPPPMEPDPEARGVVEWVERTPNRMVLRVHASGPALVVVADNWFPAWKARLDGDEAPILRADHNFRAVAVPGGTSELVMEYRSSPLRAWLTLSVASLLLLTGAGLFSGIRRQRGAGPSAERSAR